MKNHCSVHPRICGSRLILLFVILFVSHVISPFLSRAHGQAMGGQLHYLSADEGITIKQKLGTIPDGSTLRLEGIFYTGLKVERAIYTRGITIDGQGRTLLFAYNGTYDPKKKTITFKAQDGRTLTEEFNPARHYYLTNWGNLTIMDCHHVTVKNLEVWGGCSEAISINDSYPEIGLRDIMLENVTARYGGSRGLFSGGSWADGIVLKDCTITETCYGDTTHCIYFSGGHWNGGWPGFRNIKILNTTVSYSGGRHLIQLNGRFSDVEISGCDLHHGQLSAISSIGVKNGIYKNNRIYGCNRQGIVIYEDGDDDIDWNSPEQIQQWMSCHWPNQNLIIENNTIVVGPKRWKLDQWRSDSPEDKAAILMNNPIHGIRKGVEFPNKSIVIRNNLIWSPNDAVVCFYHDQEALCAQVYGNWIESKTMNPGISMGDRYFTFSLLQELYKDRVHDNAAKACDFQQFPEYPDEVNTTSNPAYWFGRDHECKVNLFSKTATPALKGAVNPLRWKAVPDGKK
ncbi:MAG: right-handed parallel beta-helix repeat-containing protein [Planctomycetota bacterium]